MSHCQHSKKNNSQSGNLPIPVYSPFLWFAGKNNGIENQDSKKSRNVEKSENSVPIFLPPKAIDSDEELITHLSQFPTVIVLSGHLKRS